MPIHPRKSSLSPVSILAACAALACDPPEPTSGVVDDELADDELAELAGTGAARPCVSDEEYALVLAEAAANAAALGLDDLSLETPESRLSVAFAWPLRQVGAADPGYYAISNYVDHDESSAVRDPRCGARTYDGHNGTDLRVWPLSWRKVETSDVEVLAAAPGTIVSRRDGNFDRQCSWQSGAKANSVAVRHADGSTAYYFHMKLGSVTTKPVGAAVAAGERLGVVASSGYSTGPHLHFEVRDLDNAVVDPFEGPCNELLEGSLWVSQPPYNDPAILKLTTGDEPLEIPPCPGVEDPHIRTQFCRGQTAVFTGFMRDMQAGAAASFVVRRPDASVAMQWSASVNQYRVTGYSWKSYVIPSKAQLGTWTFEGTYFGKTVKQTFTVGKGGGCGNGK